MLETVLATLIGTGMAKGTSVTREWMVDRMRSGKYSSELPDLETEFHGALQDSVEQAAAAAPENFAELEEVIDHWKDVTDQLDSIDVMFETTEEGIDQITAAILEVEGVSLDKSERDAIRRIVANAYDRLVEEFGERVVGTPMADEFQVEAATDITAQVRELRDEIDTLIDQWSPERRYTLYDATDIDVAIDQVLEGASGQFINRPELDDHPTPDRVFVTGPAGSGKTRVLGWLMKRVDTDELGHVLIPDDNMTSVGDKEAIAHERFAGDVLLVWDDIHRITDMRDNRVYEHVFRELQAHVRDAGYNLRVLVAARSGNVEDVPGDPLAGRGIWTGFESIKLKILAQERRGRIVDLKAEEYGVRVDTAARTALVNRADTASAPKYIDSVLRTAGDELTVADVESLPETVTDIWHEQYNRLKETDEDAFVVLEACKLLYDIRSSYFAPLVMGVYVEVLDHPRRSFRPAVESLIERQWMRLQHADRVLSNEAIYRIHDAQIEAINRHIADWDLQFSKFLLERAEEYLDDRPTDEAELNALFAASVHRNEGPHDRIRKHFARALELTSPTEDLLDSHYDSAHNGYAVALRENNQSEEAEKHFIRALELTCSGGDLLESNRPSVHNNYGVLLEETERSAKARSHFERALELTSPTGDLLDSEYSEAHTHYANFLESKGSLDTAEQHHRRALELTSPSGKPIESENWRAHTNYATLLAEDERHDSAERHYRKALELTTPTDDIFDSDRELVHHNYGQLLFSIDRRVEARRHYERCLELTSQTGRFIDGEHVKAHVHYAKCLAGKGQEGEAEKHFRRALELTSESGELTGSEDHIALHAFAGFLFNTDRIAEAVRFYGRALEIQSPTGDPIDADDAIGQYNYGVAVQMSDSDVDAGPHLKRALELTTPTSDPVDSDYIRGQLAYATWLDEQQESSNAERHFHRALELIDSREEADASLKSEVHDNFARFLFRNDRFTDAISHTDRALALRVREGRHDAALDSARLCIDIAEGSEDFGKAIRLMYIHGLGAVISGHPPLASELLGAAWRSRNNVEPDSEAYEDAVCAGICLAAHAVIGEDDARPWDLFEEVQEAAIAILGDLSRPVSALYKAVFTEESVDCVRLDSDDFDGFEAKAINRILEAITV